MNISFLGAAKQVTGSCILIETSGSKILVDCGMFQGSKVVEKLNEKPFDFNPSEIDYLLLTHAHIDHSGRIPKLVKDGFKGSIICTEATADLLDIMLKDSGHIQEMETKWRNRKNERAGRPLEEPLYTIEDAAYSLKYIKPVLYGQAITLNDKLSARFNDAGHILGSAIIEIWIRENNNTVKMVFTGDLGSNDRPIVRNPAIIEEADYLIIESTYGDRLHQNLSTDIKKFISIINHTCSKGGTVVIPAFALGRTQEIVYELNKYYERYEKAEVDAFLSTPVYVDSPLAVSATNIFKRHSDCFDDEARSYILNGDNPLEFPKLTLIKSVEESIKLNEDTSSKIIISASGMCDAGRIKHHLKHNLWKPNNSIIFIGYQASGTLGRIIRDGAKSVKIYGEEIHIKAQIHSLDGFSAHADQQGLLEWIKNIKKPPKKTFLFHGEEKSINTLHYILKDNLGLNVVIPSLGDRYAIDGLKDESYKENNIDPSLSNLTRYSENIDQLKYEFYLAMNKLENQAEEGINKKNINVLINKVIELQKNISDLNMLMNSRKISEH